MKKTMPELQIPNWVKEKQAQQEKQAQERSLFFKFPEGETEITVDTTMPPKEVNKFGKNRYQYKITVNNEIKTLEVGSMLDTLIIKALMANVNPMIVVRVGKGIKSSYSIKGLD